MKTAHTIPWEAVVEGCPPSKAKRLPLVVSASHLRKRSSFLGRRLENVLDQALGRPLAMLSRSDSSALIELFLPRYEFMAVLTSDGVSSAILQTIAVPWSSRAPWDQNLGRDSFARTYVARYARLDGDYRAFVANENCPPERECRSMSMDFLSPPNWGFGRTSSGYHWTAQGLFESVSSPQKSPKPSTLTRPRHADPFDSPPPDRGDPFRCAKQLKQIKDLCERRFILDPDKESAQNLAHHLALNLGRCRLFGVRLEEECDFTLSPQAFLLAADGLIDFLIDQIRRIRQMDRIVAESSAYLQRNLALELLEIRMDAHAAYLALEESYAAAVYESAGETLRPGSGQALRPGTGQAEQMGRRLNQVHRVINRFDGNLQEQLPLLTLAASTFLLENWRRLLAPAYRQLPPWWLDGCLES